MRYLLFGATGDLGRAVAKRLYQDRHELVLHGHRSVDLLSQLAVEVEASDTWVFDVRDESAIAVAMAGVGALDGMVYCSAINPTASSIREMSLATWREIIDINLTGAFIALRAALPALALATHPSVVLVSSIFGAETPARRSAYGASKHGLTALVQAAVREEGSWLRVNEVCPGPMWSENLRNILNAHASSAGMALEEYVLTRVNDIPLGRFMELPECAEVINFLLSPASSFISAQSLRVTGGAIQ